MTIGQRYETMIRCDELGCRRLFRFKADWTCARQAAAVEGWSYTGMPHYRDLCPDHTPTGETDG